MSRWASTALSITTPPISASTANTANQTHCGLSLEARKAEPIAHTIVAHHQ
jgi:hypothetical protein